MPKINGKFVPPPQPSGLKPKVLAYSIRYMFHKSLPEGWGKKI